MPNSRHTSYEATSLDDLVTISRGLDSFRKITYNAGCTVGMLTKADPDRQSESTTATFPWATARRSVTST